MAAPKIMQTEFVFDSAPFLICHAPTIVTTKQGLIAAWFGGEEEGSPDVGIWMSRRDSKGWSQLVQVTTGLLSNGARSACWNPVLFTADEKLLLFYRAESRSRDQGRIWSRMELIDLPNPDSGLDGIVLGDGRGFLVYNHSKRKRSPLNVAISLDGKNWRKTLTLEDQVGEYSYPAVIQSSDELVHVVYTWNRSRIKHVVLDPSQSF